MDADGIKYGGINMIVMANQDFSLAMKFLGVEKSFTVKSREEALARLKGTSKEEIIFANVSVIELAPELHEYPNLVSIPDNASDFKKIDDLKHIIKSAIGIDIEVV